MDKSKLRVVGKKIWKKTSPIIYTISPTMASKILYKLSTNKSLNLKQPQDFNEKLMWLKLNWQNELVVKCADKFEVRNYVKGCGYGNILPKLYGVYNNPKEINWSELPNKFALKCTHGCGFNIVTNNKEEIKIKDAIDKLQKWIKTRYVFEAIETQYDKMTPRIICEEYIETNEGLLPNDYKIYCFNGKPQLTLVCTERAEDVKLKFMDLDWNEMDIGNEKFISKQKPKKPKCYNDMLKIAEVLAKPFPFVRVDFYDKDGKVVLGEMTFTPAACAARYYNEKGLKILGDMLKLPNNIF